MLKIKLARFGRHNQPRYRIVVNEARDKRDGSYVELLGTYSPTTNPKELTLNLKTYHEWLKKGAQPTETVAKLAKRFKSGTPFPTKKPTISAKTKAKLQAEKEAKENPAPAAPAAPPEPPAPPTSPAPEKPAETPATEPTSETPAAEPIAEEKPVEALDAQLT